MNIHNHQTKFKPDAGVESENQYWGQLTLTEKEVDLQSEWGAFLHRPDNQTKHVGLYMCRPQARGADGSTYIVGFGKEAILVYGSAPERDE